VLIGLLAICSGVGFWFWQEDEHTPVAVFKKKGIGGADALGFLPSQNLVVIGSDDGILRFWNADKNKVSAELDEKSGAITSLVVDPNEKWIAANYKIGPVCIWDVDKKAVSSRLSDFRVNSYARMAAGPDGDTLAVAATDNSVRVWQISAQKELKKLVGHKTSVESIAIRKDGSKLVSGDTNGNIIIWDLKAGTIDHQVRAQDNDYQIQIHDILFLGDSPLFATASEDESVRIWDSRTGKQEKKLQRKDTGSIWRLALSPDGNTLAEADVYAGVRLWNVKTWERKQAFGAHFASILGLTFNKDGSQIITSCVGIDFQDSRTDAEVKVWKVK
jgi:WD40 repeat protein